MLCKKLFLCLLAFCLCGCVSKKHSVKTYTKTVTDSLVQVQIQRDTIYWHGVQVTNEKVSVIVSRWDAENNQWQPETKTDTERNTEVENKDTISEKTEHVTTDCRTRTTTNTKTKESDTKGVSNTAQKIYALCLLIVLGLMLLFSITRLIKNK